MADQRIETSDQVAADAKVANEQIDAILQLGKLRITRANPIGPTGRIEKAGWAKRGAKPRLVNTIVLRELFEIPAPIRRHRRRIPQVAHVKLFDECQIETVKWCLWLACETVH